MFKGFSIFSSGIHFVQFEQNGLSNFGRRPPKEQSYQVWLKSAQWLRRRCYLKFSFSIFSSGDHFVQWSLTI